MQQQVFKYKGYDSSGKKVDGEISSFSIEEAERRVSSQSVTIISIVPSGISRSRAMAAEAQQQSFKKPLLFGPKKIPDGDIATLLRDLAVMAETGVPFIEAVDAVIASAKTPAIQNGLRQLKSEIVGGKGLSAGMRSANGIFPNIVCDMVKVAEEGGRLDLALSSAASYMERSSELRKKVMNAMLYPIVLSLIAFSTIVILVAFVLPRFASIFEKMKADVPATTKFMLKFGEMIRSHPIQLVGGLVIGFFMMKILLRMPPVKMAVSAFLLKVPVLGELLRRLALSRAMQSIGTLLTSNVSLMAALEHGSRVSGNPVIEKALMTARVGVEHGAPLSDSLADTKAFPPMLIQMVAVGERSGRLAHLMVNTANHMESDVDGRLKAMVSIIEPLMIVVMGIIVGAITLSIIIPMYSVVENIK